MSSSAVTQFVNTLVQNGYVTRQENPEDRRLIQLKLSQKGKNYIATTKETRFAEMTSLFDALTNAELETFLRLHKKITPGFSNRKT